MTVIRQDDFIDSVADALQFISYYHPVDFLQALGRAWEREQSPAAKDAMARAEEAEAIFNWAFRQFAQKQVIREGEILTEAEVQPVAAKFTGRHVSLDELHELRRPLAGRETGPPGGDVEVGIRRDRRLDRGRDHPADAGHHRRHGGAGRGRNLRHPNRFHHQID